MTTSLETAHTDLPAEEPRPLQTPLAAVTLALILFGCASVVAIAFDFDRIGVLNRITAAAGSHSIGLLAAARHSDDQTSASGSAQALTVLLLGVSFIVWFHRAYSNLPRIGAPPLRFAQGWAIGAWFIPFLSLVRPKQIADEIWRGSGPGHEPVRVSSLVHCWWGMLMLSVALGGASTLVWDKGDSAAKLRISTWIDINAIALSMVAAGLLGAFAYRISERQTQSALGT